MKAAKEETPELGQEIPYSEEPGEYPLEALPKEEQPVTPAAPPTPLPAKATPQNTYVPAIRASESSSAVMNIQEAEQAIEYIQQIKQRILKPGINDDYAEIPGTTKKLVLLQPGAEKLCAFFGFSIEFEEIDKLEEHETVWTYNSYDRNTGEEVPHSAMGFYFYKYKCTLTTPNGRKITRDGSCCSTERGKEKSSGNTIMQIAQKRAHVNATKLATFSSNLWTADIEDGSTEHLSTKSGPKNPPKNAAGKATPKMISFISNMGKYKVIEPGLAAKTMEFLSNETLQTFDNAKALIEKLKTLPDKEKR